MGFRATLNFRKFNVLESAGNVLSHLNLTVSWLIRFSLYTCSKVRCTIGFIRGNNQQSLNFINPSRSYDISKTEISTRKY